LGDRGQKEHRDSAHQAAETYLERYPSGKHIARVLHAQGDVLYKQGRRAEASKCFARIVKDFPDHAERSAAWHDWAQCQFELGQYAEAAATFDVFL
jgi:TolA-binding protein